jgi:chromosomal replication initiation ATPase DnaA
MICPHCSKEFQLPVTRKSLRDMLGQVAGSHGVSVDELIVHNNTPRMVGARREFAVWARSQGYSLPEIGHILNRHHTTVLALTDPYLKVRRATL